MFKISEEEKTNLTKYIDSVKWQFAKTMPQWPHWYTVKSWNSDKVEEFMKLAKAIQDYGYDVPFKNTKRVFRYLDIGEYKYWWCDPTLEEVILINRAKL